MYSFPTHSWQHAKLLLIMRASQLHSYHCLSFSHVSELHSYSSCHIYNLLTEKVIKMQFLHLFVSFLIAHYLILKEIQQWQT